MKAYRPKGASLLIEGLLLSILILIATLAVAEPVYASTPNPDSTPQIISYYAYNSTYVSGDCLMLIEYNIPYATPPSATATTNFFVQYRSASGTITNVTSPFAYESNGYNYGAVALYFASGGVTWGEAGYVLLVGNPTADWASGIPEASPAPMMAGNWVSSNTTVQGRARVCSRVIELAVDLENRWNVSLTAQSATRTVLNTTYGQQYFSNVVPYFTAVCSAILTTSGAQPVNPPPAATYANQPTITYSTGTATFTFNSQEVVGSGTIWTSGVVGQFIKSNVDNEWFKVTAFSDATHLTIAIGYPFATESGVTYQIATLPYLVGLGQTWQNSVLGPSIDRASSSLGISAELYIFGTFLLIASFALGYAALTTGNPGFIPLIAIPILVGGMKIGVVPMMVGVSICSGFFILSMFLLIHRRAAV